MKKFVFDLQRFKDIKNYTPDTLVSGTSSNDTIYNSANSVTINGGKGNDSIGLYYSQSSSISGGKGNDTIYNNYSSHVTLGGGDGDDRITNSGSTQGSYYWTNNSSLDGGAGNDYIYNYYGPNSTINGGKGDDTINNLCGDSVSIDGGAGYDSIHNQHSDNVTISGGAGNDYIRNEGSYYSNPSKVTISGGAGDDTISLYNEKALIKYSFGDGNDKIYGFDSYDSLSIGGGVGVYSTAKSGNDVIVMFGKGKITLVDAASLNPYIIDYRNSDSNKSVKGTSNNDIIKNSGAKVTISGGSGDDSIQNGDYYYESGYYSYRRVWKDGGDNVSIDGGNGKDSIENCGNKVTMSGGKDDDYLYNASIASNVSINGGSGNDYIENYGSNAKISGGSDNDYVANYGSNAKISGGTGNDLIRNYGNNASIDSGEGNDTVYNDYNSSSSNGTNTTLNGGTGNDSIYNGAGYVSINAGDGKDTIENHSQYVTIIGGSGDDSISNGSSKVTIDAGEGNDLISLGSYAENNFILYKSGGGKDTIYGFDATSTLEIAGGKGTYSTQESGNDVIVKVGDGAITLKNVFATADMLHINNDTITLGRRVVMTDGNDELGIKRSFMLVNAGAGDDTVDNNQNASLNTINGESGNDYISNHAYKVTISGGEGDDTVLTVNDSVSIAGGEGKDSIYNSEYADNVTISGGDDSDTIKNYGDSASINGGAGDDQIYNGGDYEYHQLIQGGDYVTINGGTGDDYIYLTNKAYHNVIQYKVGDGNDYIEGFRGEDTLQIGGGKGTYSSQASGDDIIITVGDGKITLEGAASLSKVHIKGKKSTAGSWKLSGATATYSMSDKTLVTVKGVKSLDGLSVSDKVVTVKKASLGTSKVTISGDGYTLKLGSDVDKSSTKKAAWNISGSTATYKSSYKTAGYSLASDGKSINYTKATTAETLATIKGASSTSGLSVSDKKITLKNSALSNKVTVIGGYEFDFASDYKKATINGSSSGDIITVRGSNLSISGGAGDDTIKVLGKSTSVYGGAGSDNFIYKSGQSGFIADYAAEDTISIASGIVQTATSGSDLIFTAGNGKITVKGGADKIVTYFDSGGKHNYKKNSDDIKVITLNEDYDKETYTMSDKLRTLDASSVELDLKIFGNKFANSIIGGAQNDTLIGGKANDTLIGGEGMDVFLWNKGDGNDKILDYAEEDLVSIKGDTIKSFSSSSEDIIFTLASKSKITIKGGKDKLITYVDNKGEHIYPKIFTVKGKAITLTDEYLKKDFNVSDYDDYKTINASAVDHGLNIVGNDSANSIFGTADDDTIDGASGKDTIRGGAGNDSLLGGAGNDTLYGGEGSDTLWVGKGNDWLDGGEGADVFIYNKGDGVDRIFDYNARLDTIIVPTGQVDNVSENRDGDIVFTIGTGKIILDGMAGKYAKIVDSNGETLKENIP